MCANWGGVNYWYWANNKLTYKTMRIEMPISFNCLVIYRLDIAVKKIDLLVPNCGICSIIKLMLVVKISFLLYFLLVCEIRCNLYCAIPSLHLCIENKFKSSQIKSMKLFFHPEFLVGIVGIFPLQVFTVITF